jgi:hypothetical protein
MTKSIEDELGLPRLKDALEAARGASVEAPSDFVPEAVDENVERMAKGLANLNPASLMEVDEEGLETHDAEMNEIYGMAMSAHKELLDLGFNVEAKHAGQIFNPAAKMLQVALDASRSKSDQRLKLLRVRMEREKTDAELRGSNQEDGIIDGESVPSFMADRNELMKQIRAMKKE